MFKLNNKTRLRISLYAFHVFIAFGIYAIERGVDMSDLATYMLATAVPIVGYVWGETTRASYSEQNENKSNYNGEVTAG